MHHQTQPVKNQDTDIPVEIRATNGRIQLFEICDVGVYNQGDDCNQTNNQNEFDEVWLHFPGSQKKEPCPPKS